MSHTGEKRKKSESRKRKEYIRARVTPEQKKLFTQWCENACITEADYIRQKCLEEEPLRAVPKRRVDEKLMAQALMEIGKLGKGLNNINQAAKALNITQKQPDVIGTYMFQTLRFHEKNLTEVYEAIQELRAFMRDNLLSHDPAR